MDKDNAMTKESKSQKLERDVEKSSFNGDHTYLDLFINLEE